MNRVIRFRAWCQLTKEMFYNVTYDPSGWVMRFNDPDVHKDDEGFRMIGSTCHENEHGVNIRVDLMQSTGLYDKNGTEVWEGDIMKGEDATASGVVCFKEFKRYLTDDKNDILGWCLHFYDILETEDGVEGFSFPLCQDFLDNYTHAVIGNVHENSELL